MAHYYNQLDESGTIVARKVRLLPTTSPIPQGHTWVPWTPELDEVKQSKRGKINSDRTSQCTEPVAVTVNGTSYNWQADERSQQLILASITLAVVGVVAPPPIWRTADNIDVSVTLTDLQNIARAMFMQTNQAFAKSWLLKSMVEQATSVPEVEQVQW